MNEKNKATFSTMKILTILSGIVLLSALFIPIFYLNLGIATKAEWGFQYLFKLFSKIELLETIEGLDSLSGFQILSFSKNADLWKIVLIIFQFLFLIIGLVTLEDGLSGGFRGITFIREQGASDRDIMKQLFSEVRFRFILLIIYFLLTSYISFVEINGMAFSPTITLAFIPPILQFFVFMLACHKRNEFISELEEKESQTNSPFNLLDQQLQLFLKYKDLYAAEVLTEYEYTRKIETVKTAILNIHIDLGNITEEERIAILKKLKEAEKQSIITPEEFIKIKKMLE
ncbi:MAG: hypothetical protein E7642_00790 [Ruminococcaceae bacterium]|nr:hypothetical protein [Oscillospiraceae bacterium]